MKSLVKVLISVLALGVMASAPLLRAQDEKAPAAEGKKGGKGGKGGGMLTVERIEEVVGTLTAEQKTKIGDILKKGMADMQAAAPEERRDKMMALRKDVGAVLTAEQKAKFDAMPQGGKGGKKKQN